MKLRVIRTTVLIGVFLLLCSVALAQSGPTAVQSQAADEARPLLVMTGGNYILTIQPAVAIQSPGYRLSSVATSVDPAPGCCCKTNLPCVIK